ncbi:putative aquaporin NIP-type [Morella rubra]|uniref:Putative aquaporin NIP-type n=1 Tax=Morella rubra TaxID=262757 RepID=A0A6A1VFF2_9ROSI|nr:putative aquaporin NIP-type [Morella rubra]
MDAKSNGRREELEIAKIEEGACTSTTAKTDGGIAFSSASIVTMSQKLIAEVIGTYFVIFAGCGSVAVNKIYGSITFPGICVTWGLIVTVPLYIAAQLMGSILASGTLALVLDVTPDAYFGTVPVGSNSQSLVLEIVISFLLMFAIFAVGTDKRAVIGELAGIVVGMTILLNVLVAGPISGASMNPARSIGPAVIKHVYKGLWVYVVGPVIGTIAGGFAYNLLRFTDRPLKELARSGSFLRGTTAE